MVEILPAILPKNYEDLKNKLALVRKLVPLVQIDITDGIYVPNLTWPFAGKELDSHFERILNEQEGLPFWEDVNFEFDLMVKDAIKNFDLYTKLGASRMVFHLGAIEDKEEFKNFLEGIDFYFKDSLEFGLAINLNQEIEGVFPFVSLVDFVQVMGIKRIGFQGEPFAPEALEFVRILKEKFPGLPVSVDGGVDFESASFLLRAGADRLVVGSALFETNDIIETLGEFKNLIKSN